MPAANGRNGTFKSLPTSGGGGLISISANRTGGATDANQTSRGRRAARAFKNGPHETADSVVNRGGVGRLTEGGGLTGNENDDTDLSSTTESSR